MYGTGYPITFTLQFNLPAQSCNLVHAQDLLYHANTICYTIKMDTFKLDTAIIDTITEGLCQVVMFSIIHISTSEGQKDMRRLRVKEVAQAKGFTMARLQRVADINLKTIQAIWHNPQHDASLNTLDKIARALGVPVTELIEDVPENDPSATSKPKKVAENINTYPPKEKQ
jgi:DNA-binding Xre family transcriptional regulator